MRLVLCAAAFALLGAMTGCGETPTSGQTAQQSPSEIIVAIDRSDSTRPVRGAQFSILDRAATEAIADNIPLDVWAFDTKAVRVWGPRIPDTRDDLLPIKASQLAPKDNQPRRITRPALMFEALAADPAVRKSHHAVIILCTDGDSEVYEDRALFNKAAGSLGSVPDARIAVLGIEPANRIAWERALTPGFGDRYRLAGPSEMDAGLKDVLD